MRALFGIALAAGFLGLLGWIVAVAVSDSVDGWESVDPAERFGSTGRRILAGVLGFGMAGLSAAYAGWPMAGATVAALAGATAAVVIASR